MCPALKFKWGPGVLNLLLSLPQWSLYGRSNVKMPTLVRIATSPWGKRIWKCDDGFWRSPENIFGWEHWKSQKIWLKKISSIIIISQPPFHLQLREPPFRLADIHQSLGPKFQLLTTQSRFSPRSTPQNFFLNGVLWCSIPWTWTFPPDLTLIGAMETHKKWSKSRCSSALRCSSPRLLLQLRRSSWPCSCDSIRRFPLATRRHTAKHASCHYSSATSLPSCTLVITAFALGFNVNN